MQQLILVIHLLIAISLVSLVLIQHGKGADVGASFGSGAANTMFGSVGPASFLMKLTVILALIFFATSIGLNILTARGAQRQVDLLMNNPITTPGHAYKPSELPPMMTKNNFKPSVNKQ